MDYYRTDKFWVPMSMCMLQTLTLTDLVSFLASIKKIFLSNAVKDVGSPISTGNFPAIYFFDQCYKKSTRSDHQTLRMILSYLR